MLGVTTPMQEKPRKQEYMALRQYVRLMERSEENSTAARVNAALSEELTPRQRQMIELHYYEGLSMREVAGRLGVTESCVSRTISRGRARMRRSLRFGGRALLDSLDE